MTASTTKISAIPIEEDMREIEARLSPKQAKLLNDIRTFRAAIGPIKGDVGTMLRDLNEADVTDAAWPLCARRLRSRELVSLSIS